MKATIVREHVRVYKDSPKKESRTEKAADLVGIKKGKRTKWAEDCTGI